MESYEVPPFTLIPPEIQDLLGEPYTISSDGQTCLGTGIIAILGTARSGKTTLAYTLIDWAIEHTKRPIYLSYYPEEVIKNGIPEHWRGRVSRRDITDIYKVEPHNNGIWLSDDSAVHTSARDSGGKKGRYLSRISGIISHLGGGQTIIYTTQSLAGVDKSLFRFCETVTCVRHMNNSGLRSDRDEWRDDIDNALYLLRQAHDSVGSETKRFRDFYITISSDEKKPYRIIPYVKPNWLFSLDPKKADMLSRPFKYMPPDEVEQFVLQKDLM